MTTGCVIACVSRATSVHIKIHILMGGHSAWRKRVKAGLLAKEGGGGAIARHRPRFGRMGLFKDPSKWSNNKKKKRRNMNMNAKKKNGSTGANADVYESGDDTKGISNVNQRTRLMPMLLIGIFCVFLVSFYAMAFRILRNTRNQD